MKFDIPAAPAAIVKKPLYKSLFLQIFIAVVAGVLIGYLWPSIGPGLRPLGDGFIQLIKMIIAPLIFLVIVTGIAAAGDVKAVGRVGVKALVYFTGATLFALASGLVVANIVQPGAGLNI
ncbi:MAG: cation:dicarboxylase symporter family transporter, partial [Sinomonas sp.]|nr:cation:dicarboxylase symporter family transporter [Sinomonas sp.]